MPFSAPDRRRKAATLNRKSREKELRHFKRHAWLALVAGLTFAAGCSDAPLEPVDGHLLVTGLGKGQRGGPGGTVTGSGSAKLRLQWLSPVTSDVSVTLLCLASEHCTFSMERGVQVGIPKGALAQDTEISVTILKGPEVNFQFGPHGLQFNSAIGVSVPTSEIKDLNLKGKVVAQYWDTDPGTVLEELEARIRQNLVSFSPTHFSGYALAM